MDDVQTPTEQEDIEAWEQFAQWLRSLGLQNKAVVQYRDGEVKFADINTR